MRIAMTTMKRTLLAMALGGLGLAGAGCGQTSYFSVDVIVSGATGRNAGSMQEVASVAVKVEGAASDQFGLENFPRPTNYSYPRDPKDHQQIILGTFQYGTTSESGNVNFKVTVNNGSLQELASGSGEGTIQAGSSVAMSVTVDPVSTWN